MITLTLRSPGPIRKLCNEPLHDCRGGTTSNKLKDPDTRLWCTERAAAHGWTRSRRWRRAFAPLDDGTTCRIRRLKGGLGLRAGNDVFVPPKRGYTRRPRTKLAQLRAQVGLEQEELGLRAGVPTRTLQRLEAGQVPNAVLQLVALADTLDCTIDELVEDAWHRRRSSTR